MKGRGSGRYSLSTEVGSGSRAQDLHGEPVMMVLTSSMETGLRVSRVCVDGGRNERGFPPLVDLRTASILSLK